MENSLLQVNKKAHDLACFLSPEAVSVGKKLGIISYAFPATIQASRTHKCRVLGKETGNLFIAVVKNGADENALKNILSAALSKRI